MNSFQILFVAVCGCVALTAGNPNVISFADFLEFDVGIHEACKNNPEGDNSTWAMIAKFTECTHQLSPTPPQDVLDNFGLFCTQKEKYLQCWNNIKAEVLKTCGQDKEPMLPAVYISTQATFCGDDNGASTIGTLKNALGATQQLDHSQCSPTAATNWVDTCEQWLGDMFSANLCTRHAALDNCLKKTTCMEVDFAKYLSQVYSNVRTQLKCT